MRRRKFFSAIGAILWTSLFLTGLTFVFLFLFGYRYDTEKGEVFSSGVLSVQTYPSSAVFFDGEFIGMTPIKKEGGIRVGMYEICFEKTGYKTRCEKTYIIMRLLLPFRFFPCSLKK